MMLALCRIIMEFRTPKAAEISTNKTADPAEKDADNREHCYDALDQPSEQIRVVTVHPGDFADPIVCDLQLVFLDDKPYYEALSYVCGESSATRSIILDGRIKQVAVKLEQALRRLRKRDRPRIMWIDAICINQEDKEEKGHQVALMGRIYSCTAEAVLWLEHDADLENTNSEGLPAEDEVNEIALHGDERDKELLDSIYFNEPLDEPLPISDYQRQGIGALGLFVLLLRQHFCKLPGMEFVDGHLWLSDSFVWAYGSLDAFTFRPWWSRIWELVSNRNSRDSLRILPTLAMFRGRDARDARDKIYAFPAFDAETWQDILIISDYSMGIQELFILLYINFFEATD
ncbi:heterokaryon incompatibility protein-domain-containing protein [Lineolata rhizophorae]|uniref:Heterokaryon incompatibility protein-domain-containing protein n=1 Tax=Lineolata rhizophorae TaxID=578093 RepID=A0A6A6NRG6_9PEZI|nr:heterokaryon incompatibility protein-domain-containing protein [Lineolata rhizophorae]